MLIIPLSVFTVGQLLVLSSNYMLGYELSLYSVRFLIVVIAGRVIPFFTRRAIGMEPKWDQPILEKLTILSVLLLIFEPLFKTSSVVGEYIWIGLTFIALVLNTFRLVNWRFFPAFKVKILFILYVAYLWLPIHFALSFANHFQWVNGNGKGILHALSYGCMGVMILGIIHRVTLGHTGRVIKAGLISIMAYAFLSLGSLIRVFGPILDPTNYILWIQASGIMWALSFVFIGFEIIPMLISSRVDGKEY